MKVKHWAGYGTLEARTIRRYPSTIVIEVSGNHEQGLEPRYFTNYDWMRWLGKRFRIDDGKDWLISTQTFWDEEDSKEKMIVQFIEKRSAERWIR